MDRCRTLSAACASAALCTILIVPAAGWAPTVQAAEGERTPLRPAAVEPEGIRRQGSRVESAAERREAARRKRVEQRVARSAALGASQVQSGWISFYARHFHGRRTASGHAHDMHALTMAHPHWPFGEQVRVTTLGRPQRSVVVTVDDRGPFHARRIADLSHAAARALHMTQRGVVRARIERLGPAGAAPER